MIFTILCVSGGRFGAHFGHDFIVLGGLEFYCIFVVFFFEGAGGLSGGRGRCKICRSNENFIRPGSPLRGCGEF